MSDTSLRARFASALRAASQALTQLTPESMEAAERNMEEAIRIAREWYTSGGAPEFSPELVVCREMATTANQHWERLRCRSSFEQPTPPKTWIG